MLKKSLCVGNNKKMAIDTVWQRQIEENGGCDEDQTEKCYPHR